LLAPIICHYCSIPLFFKSSVKKRYSCSLPFP